MPAESPKPDFVGIGAQRSATTWLYRVMAAHDEIYLPPVKELHYFDRLDRGQHTREERARGFHLYKKNKNRYLQNLLRLVRLGLKADVAGIRFYKKFLFEPRDDEWYGSLFKTRKRLAGEITPSYATISPELIDRLVRINPEVRVVYLLRNPVDRAWSQFRYELDREQAAVPAERLAADFERFLDDRRQIVHGNYSGIIERWSARLVPGRFFIGFYDAVVHHPDRFLRSLAAFLDVEELLDLPRANTSSGPEMPVACLDLAVCFYRDEVDLLSRTFGGYFSEWLAGKLVSSADFPVGVVL